MNTINQHNSIYFGQLVPTNELLKCALNIHRYEDAKALVTSYDNRFPGHQGFSGKAKKFVESALEKNQFLKEIVEKLKQAPNKKTQELEIKNIISQYGNKLDIDI